MRRLFDQLLTWHAHRAHLNHCRRLRSRRVFIGNMKPEPRCVVRNLREPN
jgi:hypothetical protein